MSITKRRLTWGLSLGVLVALFLQPTLSIEYIRRGMSVCVRTMIPSLFPFMVVSELIVRSGAGEAIARLPARLFGRWMGLSAEGISACLLGWLCGFPVGSRAAAGYWRQGRLSDRQFNVVLAMCNVPSSAFLICAVGVSLFGRREVGWRILILTLLSASAAGAFVALLLGRSKTVGQSRSCVGGRQEALEADGLLHMLPEAISSAASAMLNVCATVLFFSALTGALSGLLEAWVSGQTVRAICLGFFEMSGGVCAAALLPGDHTALVLCAAIIGWGGLSVHCQIFSVCRYCPLHVLSFWVGRACQAVICGGGMWLWMKLSPLPLPIDPPSLAWRELLDGSAARPASFAAVWSVGCCLAFAFGVTVCGARKWRGGRV